MPPTVPPPQQSALQRKRRSPRCPKRPLRLPLLPYGRQQESASAAQTPSRHRTLQKSGRQRRGTATRQLVGSRTARPRTGGPSGRCRGRRPPLLHRRCRRPQTRKVAGSPRRRLPQRGCQSPMPEPTPVCNQDSGRRIRICGSRSGFRVQKSGRIISVQGAHQGAGLQNPNRLNGFIVHAWPDSLFTSLSHKNTLGSTLGSTLRQYTRHTY